MMPLHPALFVGYALAVLFGFAFGFVLERAGFGDARKLAAQFYLTDMRVLKVMFTAIVTAALGLAALGGVGALDLSAIYVNPTHLGAQVVGGLIFGVGFVIGGHCPGTAVVSAVTGRINGMIFLLGAGFGVLGYSLVSGALAPFANAGGERLLLGDWLHLPYGVVAALVAALALAMFAGAEWLERFMSRRQGAPSARKPRPRRVERALAVAACAVAVLAVSVHRPATRTAANAAVPVRLSAFEVARILSEATPEYQVLTLAAPRHTLTGALPAARYGTRDEDLIANAPRAQHLILIGADAVRTDRVARRLAAEGVHVSVLAGGVDAWDRAMDSDPPSPAAGASADAWQSYELTRALRQRFGSGTRAAAAPVIRAAPEAAPAAPATKKREGC